ncbi:MAG: Cysteine desulfurase NifS [Thermoanaerobaculia bacterium]|nr:Cysteine desulfurase NifS [Thermoanaerobaculia bacterium]
MTPRGRIYADYNATSPLDPEVLEAMLPWLSGFAGNPSSVHEPGRQARRAIEEARGKVAAALGADPSEIVFTSGGTESNNLAVLGGARAGRRRAPGRVRIATSSVEHPAVREPARMLAEEGFTLTELPVHQDSVLDVESTTRFLANLEAQTLALVSVILANNETGAVNTQLGPVFGRAREAGAVAHTDAVQAVGKIPVNVRELAVDLLSLTAHKFGGPSGAGALFVRKGMAVEPVLRGGAQEKGRRGGTENVAAVVGLGTAIEKATRRLAEETVRLQGLRQELESGLSRLWPAARINAADAPRTPGVTSAAFRGLDAEMLVIALDLAGIAVSTGAACSTGTVSASRVLAACGLPAEDVRGTVRFSLGPGTSHDDVEEILAVLPGILDRMMPRRAAGRN